MKPARLIPIVILVGIAVLFFFPEPQTNFLFYLATALSFGLLIVYLAVKSKKK